MELPKSNSTKFQIIQGGGQTPSPWLDIPSVVIGRSTQNKNLNVVYRIAQSDVKKALNLNRRQPIFDLWSAVLGEIPPVPNAKSKWANINATKGLTSLLSATSCFRGLKRPVGDDDHGFDTFAFITKPTCMFRYEPSMGCTIRPVDVPSDLVHVTYVRMDYPEGRATAQKVPDRVIGIVTHWEFVEADPLNPELPLGFAERYRQRMW